MGQHMAEQESRNRRPSARGTAPKARASRNGWSTRVARLASRKYDWNALKFQADYDPKYRRAQMRYVGTGGTGVAKSDVNVVPAEHFTFSTMLIPAGREGPDALHTDVEEIFFVIRGKMKVMLREGTTGKRRGKSTSTDRDLISIPPGVYRGETTSARRTR